MSGRKETCRNLCERQDSLQSVNISLEGLEQSLSHGWNYRVIVRVIFEVMNSMAVFMCIFEGYSLLPNTFLTTLFDK